MKGKRRLKQRHIVKNCNRKKEDRIKREKEKVRYGEERVRKMRGGENAVYRVDKS